MSERHPTRGYLLAMTAAAMWAMNGSLARFLLDDGVKADRLSQLRSTGSLLILLVVLLLVRPRALRVDRRDLPALAFIGIVGLAGVHATYFVAIDRLEIGVALVIQYLGPLLLLLWLRFVHGVRLPGSLWAAVALSVLGCFFVVRAYDAGSLEALGVLAAFGAAVTFAIYMRGSERAGQMYEPSTTLFWAFGFASLFWAAVNPWWTFPAGEFATSENILLGLGVIVIGTLLPFVLMLAALRHIPAHRAAVVATLEPVLAAIFAWIIHDEALASAQLAGGAMVIAAVIWVQSHRPDLESEAAPPLRAATHP